MNIILNSSYHLYMLFEGNKKETLKKIMKHWKPSSQRETTRSILCRDLLWEGTNSNRSPFSLTAVNELKFRFRRRSFSL